MSELDAIQSTHLLDDDSATETLLDGSSLGTVLAMLEVIDSLEELALLETLTSAQKRQVWAATPESSRDRLKQLRIASQNGEAAKTPPRFQPADDDGEGNEAIAEAEAVEEISSEAQLQLTQQLLQQRTDAVRQSGFSGPQNGSTGTAPLLAVGDWIVLQARPQLSRSELMAIWEVLEVAGSNARIFAQQLGQRTYPMAWMMLYPKPADYVEPEF